MFKPRGSNVKGLATKSIDEILIKALPDQESYIRSAGSISHYHLADVLRTRILEELQKILAGKE